MSEFIGSRISLVSKSDIRYVGTLSEINSENSTVALENVQSFGTEGRKDKPEEELPASGTIFEYIVFRGSDVKDLRIEEPPKENKPPPPPPQVPNDPAILGSGTRPVAYDQGRHPPGMQQPAFHQHPQYPYPPQHQYPPQRLPGGPESFHGQYGPPPGWFPQAGAGFPNQGPGPFSPNNMSSVPYDVSTQPDQHKPDLHPQPPPQEVSGITAESTKSRSAETKAKASAQAKNSRIKPTTPGQTAAPSLSTELQSDPNPLSLSSVAKSQHQPESNDQARVPKPGKIIPAVPLQPSASKPKSEQPESSISTNTGHGGQIAANAALQYQNATQAATAAVAAAMAKLPPLPGQKPKTPAETEAVDNLTKKVNELRTDDRIRHSKQPGTGGFAAGNRGRGSRRAGRGGTKGIDVPSSDFDFESANAKFNKEDLMKEAIATGSPTATPSDVEVAPSDGAANGGQAASEVIIPPAPIYTKSSFFDNISSEAKEREDVGESRRRGLELRTEERKRNMETFGLGSVDGGHRGGNRGRGRGNRGLRGGLARGRGFNSYRARGHFVATRPEPAA